MWSLKVYQTMNLKKSFMLLLFFFLYPSKIIKKWIHLYAQMNETQSSDLFISNKDYCK